MIIALHSSGKFSTEQPYGREQKGALRLTDLYSYSVGSRCNYENKIFQKLFGSIRVSCFSTWCQLWIIKGVQAAILVTGRSRASQ